MYIHSIASIWALQSMFTTKAMDYDFFLLLQGSLSFSEITNLDPFQQFRYLRLDGGLVPGECCVRIFLLSASIYVVKFLHSRPYISKVPYFYLAQNFRVDPDCGWRNFLSQKFKIMIFCTSFLPIFPLWLHSNFPLHRLGPFSSLPRAENGNDIELGLNACIGGEGVLMATQLGHNSIYFQNIHPCSAMSR